MSKNFPFQIIKNSNKGLTVLEQGLPLPSIKKEKKKREIYARGHEAQIYSTFYGTRISAKCKTTR